MARLVDEIKAELQKEKEEAKNLHTQICEELSQFVDEIVYGFPVTQSIDGSLWINTAPLFVVENGKHGVTLKSKENKVEVSNWQQAETFIRKTMKEAFRC